jgi:hypothetical protein
MSLNLKIINPLEYNGWDELLLSNTDYSFFHTSHWARVLSESYDYKPLYFTVINNSKLSVLIPVMEVNSFITGKRGVSLPFTDYCKLIIDNDINSRDIFDSLIEYGKKDGWKYFEIRDGGDLFNGVPISSYYYGHTLNLSNNEEEIFSSFRSSTRRNIRKAIREGVKVSINNSHESIKEFYRLHCMKRKEQGLPPQPYSFFKKVFEHIITKDHGSIILASYMGKIIAGAIYFHFGEKAMFKYGSSDSRFQHLRANNLVMWEAIQWYCQNQHECLCFGRTDTDHDGLRQFKAGWGTKEKIIKYYKYDLKESMFKNGTSPVSGYHNRIFRLMPVHLSKLVGKVLYRHVG